MIAKVGKLACLSVFGCVALSLMLLHAPAECFGFEITIDVAPNVLNIQSEGQVVTVHTDIAYGSVYAYSVSLNGVEIHSWKADNRGNFVAKFLMDEIKKLDGLSIDGYNTLTLIGATTGGDSFLGTQDIKVIDVIPQGEQ